MQRGILSAILIGVGFLLMQFASGALASIGAAIFFVALIWMVISAISHGSTAEPVDYVADPPWWDAIFSTSQFSAVWLALRLLVGFEWLEAGLHKLEDPAWMQTGEALRGYWERAVAIPETGRPAITFDWYRSFLQGMLDTGAYSWFAKLIAIGEAAVGIALIVGLFVGIAAIFGAFMNFNFMLAGSASVNPVLFVGALLLISAWKVAGYYGLDRFVLPAIGAPWSPGRVFREPAK
jgi:thiosulfate dehydrogenase (quinone) large subunit